jgi:hypothetical protein
MGLDLLQSCDLRVKRDGHLTDLFKDLELCGFIDRYVPSQADSHSTLVQYCIAESYLRFYFKFIAPLSERIDLRKRKGQERIRLGIVALFLVLSKI